MAECPASLVAVVFDCCANDAVCNPRLPHSFCCADEFDLLSKQFRSPMRMHVLVDRHYCYGRSYVDVLVKDTTRLDGARTATVDGAYAYVCANNAASVVVLDIC